MDAQTEDWFGFDVAHAGRALAEAMGSGADFADLFFERRRSGSIGLEDGVINRGSTAMDRGVGVRAVCGSQTGYAYSEALELEPVLRAARTAAAIASGSRVVDPLVVRAVRVPDHYPLVRPWEAVGVAEKLALVREIERLAHELDPELGALVEKVQVSWGDSESHAIVATSEGALLADRRPMGVARVSVTASKNGQRCTGSASLARRADFDWFSAERIQEMVRKALDCTAHQFEARRPPAGEMPVLLAAGESGILLHEAIGHGLEADANRKGVSIYADKMGERVAPEFVTVVDDGTLDHERGALNVDDEGQEGERSVLIEGGVLRSYLHDRISAAHYGVPGTGSGRRQSFRHAPMPRMRCTFMEDGPHSRDEMIASVKRGIVAESFTNGEVKIGAGDFTFYVKTGYLIEDGRITAPIKDINIIGNGPQALRDISMVADDGRLDTGGWTCGKAGQSVPVSQGLPSTLVARLTVGGAGA